jgi:hypothetical protein
MLLLADRNFAGHELWGLVEATGCHWSAPGTSRSTARIAATS